MKELILVGCGGALGAILRYGLGLLPMRTSFPFMTMLINILGALCIGTVSYTHLDVYKRQPYTCAYLTAVSICVSSKLCANALAPNIVPPKYTASQPF